MRDEPPISLENSDPHRTKILFLAFTVLLLVNVVFFIVTESWLSVPRADDPYYQGYALHYPGTSIAPFGPNGSWGYVMWYKLLGVLGKETRFLTDANNISMSVGLSALVFAHVARGARSPWTPFAAGCLVVLSYLNMTNWPKVSHFAIILVLAGMLAVRGIKRPSLQFSCFALTLLCVSFVRPELMIGACFSFVLALGSTWQERGQYPLAPSVFALAGTIAIALLVHFIVGLPMFDDMGRSGMALGQHFAVNWVEWTADPRSPWLEYKAIWSAAFGQADGIIAALRANPGLMQRHLGENALRFVLLMPTLPFIPVNNAIPIVPVSLTSSWMTTAYVSGYVFVLAIIISLARGSVRCALFQREKISFVQWLCVLAAPAVSCVLIYPRYHYMLWFMIALLIYGWTALDQRWGRRNYYWLWVAGFLAGTETMNILIS
ncbi:MAG: hypothetical protein P4M00_06750 [Azospirillaceae bacterium]|nr:hypothetical protein [Azospirillaceae bacterium]